MPLDVTPHETGGAGQTLQKTLGNWSRWIEARLGTAQQTAKDALFVANKATTNMTKPGAGFTEDLVQNGWIKFPDGFIIQWGKFVASTGNGDVLTFNIPFPTAAFSITITDTNADGWLSTHFTGWGTGGLNRTSVQIYGRNIDNGGIVGVQGGSIYWIATGN